LPKRPLSSRHSLGCVAGHSTKVSQSVTVETSITQKQRNGSSLNWTTKVQTSFSSGH
jgi:hypothetical protein